ncbi:MAG: hypothetical protein V3T72_07835 [Thermoanaerobaculia bacterium]
MSSSIRLADALRAANEDARSEIAAHPGPDELLAYHAGELADDKKEELRDHLAVCRECTRTVLDVASFPELLPRDPERALSRRQLADEIAAIRSRLVDERSPLAEVVPLPPPRAPRIYPPAWPIAAMLALAAAGLSFWVHSLRGTVSSLHEPTPNSWTASLTGTERSGQSGPETVEFTEGQERRSLTFNYLDPAGREFSDYAIEIFAMDGELVWGTEDLRPHPQIGNFSLGLHRDFLAAGEYRFVLYGLEQEARERLASYLVRIDYH